MLTAQRNLLIIIMFIISFYFISCTKDPGPNWSPNSSPSPADNSSKNIKGWEIIMGVSFGASEIETMKKIPNLICKTDSRRSQRRECQDSKFEIGRADIESNEFVFMNDKLMRVRFTYDVDDFNYIKKILINKYGKPTEELEISLTDKNGSDLKREIVKWESAKVRAMLVKNDPSSAQGSAVFIDVTEENERKSQIKTDHSEIIDDSYTD